MALLTSPIVLNDGVTDRTFSFRSQQPDKKSVVGDYIEDAAPIAAESLLVVKHDNSGSVPRHLFQRTEKAVPAAATDGILRRKTINVTIVADPLFTAAEVQKDFELTMDAMSQAGLLAGMLSSKL